MSTMNEAALHFTDVHFAYEQEAVLHDINVCIPSGSFVAVVGPNGGGKTTFVKLVLGLLKPQRGTVNVLGCAPHEARKRIGYVPQYVSFDAEFPVSVMDVVLMGRSDRHWFGSYRKSDRAKALDSLKRVGLEHLSRRPLSQLSGGERQRVLIAQALATEPNLLLLDEPTANVDARVEQDIYRLLHELNTHITIIVVSHNLSVVTRHASHLVCVNRALSLSCMGDCSEGELNAMYRGDMALLNHNLNCHVVDQHQARVASEQ